MLKLYSQGFNPEMYHDYKFFASAATLGISVGANTI